MLELGQIEENLEIGKSYYRIVFRTPGISSEAKAGQFVHVKIFEMPDRILRRPFSICDADAGSLTIVYKTVGEGTEKLSTLKPGAACDLMGPLGKGFSPPSRKDTPVIIAGGYGVAATYLLAKNSPCGIILIGARTKNDLILLDEFKRLGFEIRIATEDGSAGEKGFVTKLLDQILSGEKTETMKFYACGPHPMLMKTGEMLIAKNLDGELSLDHKMCCGVGACFACVEKMKDSKSEDGWRYARTCVEGPVFKASEVYSFSGE